MDASKGQREELSDRAATLRWVRRGARAPLERLLRRWDDADTHWEDFRIEGAGTDDAAPPIEPKPSPRERAKRRAELNVALERHRPWLTRQFRQLSNHSPPMRLRRLQFELDPGALHDGLSLRGLAYDASGDEAHEAAPQIPMRTLWPRAIASAIGSCEGGWLEMALECVEKWTVECFREASPTLTCPAYLSVHESLERGLNLQTGRRTTFRDT
jgi:hypothetical protein